MKIYETADQVQVILNQISLKMQFAYDLAIMDSQINNGGFTQLIDNKGKELVITIADRLGNLKSDSENIKIVERLLRKSFRYYERFYDDNAMNEDEFSEKMDELDDQYYEIGEKFISEVETILGDKE